ncbi:TrmH family RNA methyltransferase [Chloroflexota bacterium]
MSVPLKPLKWYKKLAIKKGRLEAGAFIVEGERLISQIIGSHPDEITEIITIEKPPYICRSYPVRFVTREQFHSICSTITPQGIMAIVNLPRDVYSEKLPDSIGNKILLLEDIQDPGNLGTLIRTAAAFDFSGVIMTKGCADPLSPKCVQATVGTVFSLWLRKTARYLDIARNLRKDNYTLVATELNGMASPSIISQQEKLLLALGNEASGLSLKLLKLADYRVRIPIIREKVESLNVASCGAIFMYLSSQEC